MRIAFVRTTRFLRAALAAALAFALAALAPGLAPYAAAAGVVNGPFGAGRVSAPIRPVALSAMDGVQKIIAVSNFAFSAAATIGVVGPRSASAGASLSPAVAGASFASRASPAEADGARVELTRVAEGIVASRPERRAGLLDDFFAGATRSSGIEPAASPTSSIRLEGARLRPRGRFLVAAAESPRPPADPPAKNDAGYTAEEVKRAVGGLTANRFFSMIAMSMSAIAYPLMVIEAVGPALSYDLSTWAALANVPLSLLAGKIGDMMPKKKYGVFNAALRSAISIATACMFAGQFLTFGPLLFMTILSAWQFASLFNVEPALQVEVNGTDVGRNRSTEALIRMTTIFVIVVSGLTLGVAAIRALGYFWTFMLVGSIQLISPFVLWKTLPEGGGMSRSRVPSRAQITAAVAEAARSWAERVRNVFSYDAATAAEKIGELAGSPEFLRKAAMVVSLGTALGIFLVPIPGLPFLLKSPVPFVIVSALLLWRSKIYQTVIKPVTLLKTSLLFVIVGAFIETPMRNSVLGVLADETNPAAAVAYLGSMIAAFYLGQAPSGTGMLDPKLTIDGLGPWKFKSPIPLRPTMKWIGALGMAAWVSFVLIPKGALAAGLTAMGIGGLVAAAPLLATSVAVAAVSTAVVAGYFALHDLTPKIQDSAWMRVEAGALLFMAFPLLFWGAPWAMYLALAVFGFVLNGSQRMLSATFNVQAKKAAPEHSQFLIGMRGSFMNVATSVALAIYGLAKTIPAHWGNSHAFPFTWYVLASIYAVFAAMFWRASVIFKKAQQSQPPVS